MSRGWFTTIIGGIALAIGVLVMLSNPVGWAAMLTGALSLSAGIAGTTVGVAELTMSYTGVTTPAQEADINRATADVVAFAGSPGGIIGGVAGDTYWGGEEGLSKGSLVGGLAEGGLTLTMGLGRMGIRESSLACRKAVSGTMCEVMFKRFMGWAMRPLAPDPIPCSRAE